MAENQNDQKALGPNETEDVEKEPFVDPNSGAAPQPGSVVAPGVQTNVPDPEAVSRAQSQGALKMAEQEQEAQAKNREIADAGAEAQAKEAEKKSSSRKSSDK